jgi:hypothetical protein
VDDLRTRFLDTHGYWSPALQAMLDADPVFFETYVGLAGVPFRSGPLEPKN